MTAASWTWILFLASVITMKEASLMKLGSGFYKLRVLHTNDMHARFEQVSERKTSETVGKCYKEDADNHSCYGGFARLKAALLQEIEIAKKENISLLILNAGDTYQGTVWYTLFKWKVVLHFMNMMPFDAMCLGNHEFDNGIPGLVPFLANTTIPTVSCNIDSTDEPDFTKVGVKSSIVVERGGKKIGIVGYITPQTATMANPGRLKFIDEIEAVSQEVKKLKSQGVEVIIALGHSGYDLDLILAQKVPDVDLVVGGHSHTFLYTGVPPSIERPVNIYPVIVTQPSGKIVPVVQAYAYTKYLGKVDLTFNEKGDVVEATGNPILLDYQIPQDPEMLADLNEWASQLNQTLTRVIGKTAVVLDGNCRFEECNLGNFITDAYVHYAVKNRTKPYWTAVSIALQQAGGIRASIDVTVNNGTITKEDLMTVMPFFTPLSVVVMKGHILKEALEWSVARYDIERRVGRGEFLQFSGIRVKYNLNRRVGNRVVSARVRCTECEIPVYSDLKVEEDYTVVMPTFLTNGGDNFSMFKGNVTELYRFEEADTRVVREYIEDLKLIYPGIEERIQFVESKPGTGSSAGSRIRLNKYFLGPILMGPVYYMSK